MKRQGCLDVLSIDPADGCDSICLYCNKEDNMFLDEDGDVIDNVFEMITPNDLRLFREYKEYMVVRHRAFHEVICELHYPSVEDENYYFRDVCRDYT